MFAVPALPLVVVHAQAKEEASASKTDATKPEQFKPEQQASKGSVTVSGTAINYDAFAGTLVVHPKGWDDVPQNADKDDKNQPAEASMFYVAYFKSDGPNTHRPVTFLYNGGPGSSTVWLHMGAFGPRRVYTVDGSFTPPAPYKLVDNPESLLDKTDLVFIDAMGTGYSHAVCKAEDKNFYGIDEDVEAFGQFIVTYLSRNDRWNSPKLLIGESYGTFRSAALGNYLQNHDTVHLNGIVLISSVLDLSTLSFLPNDDRSYIYYLPSYAAVAWYHKVLKDRQGDVAAFIDAARKFAQGEYATALSKGSELSTAEKADVAKKVSYFTGLSEDYLLKADLRVTLGQFRAELQRKAGLTTGRIDARFTGYTYDLL
jgi:carboxypeptidase C (cathepsin A)